MNKLLHDLYENWHNQAVLYGEVYGQGIQSFTYGEKAIAFRAFDLMIDGKYLNHDDFVALCTQYGVETVPLVYRGEFSLATIKRLSDGASQVGGQHGREGVVVKPVIERQDGKIGR